MVTRPLNGMSTGYSGKSLVDKLGYKPSETIQLIAAPQWFSDHLDSLAITPAVKGSGAEPHWGHVFCANQADLELFVASHELESVTNGWWCSWPKKSSGIASDITEQSFRDALLPLGWVDVKVVAIDDTWSGLLFRRRRS